MTERVRMLLRRAGGPATRALVDGWLLRWGVLALVVLALIYYGQYYDAGLNLGGEGGTAGVIAMRLNEGLLPIVDTYLGYNVLWFYPVAWVFQVTGPNEIALRVYFFALCALIGIFGFLTVRRVTGRGWLALGTGVLLILIPGMLFRNYMGLLPVLNGYLLLQAFVLEPRSGRWRWVWFALAGLGIGLTFLVRLDLGVFLTVIAAGLVVLYPLGVRGQFWRRTGGAAAGGALCVVAAVAIHVPFYVDAERRGFGENFTGQYSAQWEFLRYSFDKEILSRLGPPQAAADRAVPMPTVTESSWIRIAATAEPAAEPLAEDHTRPRDGLSEIDDQDSFYDAVFIVILHTPLLVGGIIFVFASGGLLLALIVRDPGRKAATLTCLVTLGCALTLFPQYFFFRPDTPHLSEFMCPFLVAMVCASWHAAGWAAATRWTVLRVGCWGFVGLCVVSEGLYFYHSWPKESAGTIALQRKRDHAFVADNGVRVFLKRRERERVAAIHDAVVAHSTPNDWVVTFPYSPTINFMTNRRSYLHNLYVDNATAPRSWVERTIEEFDQYRPAVIVLDHRDINGTEFSRFRNWAAPVRDYIRLNYVLIGVFGENEIFVRPDRLTPDYQPPGGVNSVDPNDPRTSSPPCAEPLTLLLA